MTLEAIAKMIDKANRSPINENGSSSYFDRLPRIYYADLPEILRAEADRITPEKAKRFLLECYPVGALDKFTSQPEVFRAKILEALHASKYLIESLPGEGKEENVSLIGADFVDAWRQITQSEVPPLFFQCLQGEALNNLIIAPTKDLKPDLYGNASVNVGKNFQLKINDYPTLKGGAIPPAALQLFDCFNIAFTQAPTRTAKIRLPLKTYMEWRGLSDVKAARQQVLDGIKVLKSIEYTAKEKIRGKWRDSGSVSLYGGTGYIRNGIIYFNFNSDFYENLLQYTPMAYCKDGLKINTKQFPHAYYFNHWIALNYRQNEGKARVNTITVKTLLAKSPLMPTYEEISRTTRQYYKRIIKPFIENLDALENLYYDFIGPDDQLIADPAAEFKGPGGYDRFIESKLRIDYDDYPTHEKRLAARERHRQEYQKAKDKEAGKIAAKAEANKKKEGG